MFMGLWTLYYREFKRWNDRREVCVTGETISSSCTRVRTEFRKYTGKGDGPYERSGV